MDLKIKDVAELLNVSETTVRRWLIDRKIPAYRLNRQYRFSRIEIENWMMKQKLHFSEESQEHQNSEVQIYPVQEQNKPALSGLGAQQFSLYRAINKGGVYDNIVGDNKETIIRNTMEVIAKELLLDPEVLSELLIDREKLMPTALNQGIAVPHARECLSKVPFDLITIVFPKKPIEYGALDGKPVDILFFLFATGDKTHLHLLAKIAHLSSNPKALSLLKSHPSKGTLLEFIKEWEGNLRATHD